MTTQLTQQEVRQCYHGIEFALKDFRAARTTVISLGVMTEHEADQQEQRLRDLEEKLLNMYDELGGY